MDALDLAESQNPRKTHILALVLSSLFLFSFVGCGNQGSRLSDRVAASTLTPSRKLIASDITNEALLDSRSLVPFKSLDFPQMVKASEAVFLNDDDYVLGITGGGESR